MNKLQLVNDSSYKNDINYDILFHTSTLVHSDKELNISWHNELEVIRILEGEGIYTIDGRQYNVRPGSFIIINPNQLHSATAKIGRPIVFESLKFKYDILMGSKNDSATLKYISPLINNEKYLPNTILTSMPIYTMFSSLFYQISETFNDSDIFKHILLKSYILNLIYLFYKNRYIYKKSATTSTKKSSVDLIRNCVEYINTHYKEDIDLDFMTINLETSKPHLCRVFKRHTNQTLTEYINDYRINKACEILSTTNTPVTEIAFSVGYSNLSYFNARFKKKTFLTPLQYRDTYKKR